MASQLHPPILPLAPINAGEVVTTANSNPDPPMKRTSKGRRKIAIEKIEDKSKKHVAFSKRRKGLFSKARELCVLCGASVAVIAFSGSGKSFSFGHPSTDSVIHRFLHGASSSHLHPPPPPVSDPVTPPGFWWERPVEELGFGELEAFAAALGKLRGKVASRIQDLYELDQVKDSMVEEVKIEFVDDDDDVIDLDSLLNDNDDPIDLGSLLNDNDDPIDLDSLLNTNETGVGALPDFRPPTSATWKPLHNYNGQQRYQQNFDDGEIGSIVSMAMANNRFGQF